MATQPKKVEAFLVKILAIAALGIGLFLSPWAARGQTASTSTSISPVTFELSANPGETVTNIVKVTNVSADPIAYKMEVQPFIGNEIGQATVVPDRNDPHPELAIKDWATLSPSTFTLAPKGQQLVTVTIKIPKNAEPGGRYGTVLASTTNTSQLDGSGAVVNQKVGTLVLLRVQGAISYKAVLKSFDVGRKLYERSPIDFSTRLHNDSTVHIKPKGFVTISNTFGRKVVDVAVEERNILPDSDRLLATTVDQKLAIGRYTASLALIYGDKNETLTATTSFIVFPWKVGLPIVAAVILMLWFVIARRQRIKVALRVLAGRS